MTDDDKDHARLPGERFRRVLLSMCASDTMTRIVDPVLADFQDEMSHHAAQGHRLTRAALRGRWCVALAMALLLHFVARPVGPVERDAQRRLWRNTAIGCGLLTAFLTVMDGVPTTSPELAGALWIMLIPARLAFGRPIGLLPARLVVAIPCGVLFGALSVGRVSVVRRRSALVMALACAFIVLGLVTYVVPSTNQAFRVSMYEALRGPTGPGPSKGLHEMSFAELRDKEKTTPARAAEYGAERHRRLALVVACLAFGWFGTALAGTRLSQNVLRRLALAAVSVLGYYALFVWGSSLARNPAIGSMLPVWLADVTFGALAVAVQITRHRSPRRSATPA